MDAHTIHQLSSEEILLLGGSKGGLHDESAHMLHAGIRLLLKFSS